MPLPLPVSLGALDSPMPPTLLRRRHSRLSGALPDAATWPHDLGEMDPDQFFEHCWQPMVLYVVFMAFWTPTEAAVPCRQVQGLAREGPEAASHALAR